MELSDKYAEIEPKFYLAELNYVNKKATLLMSQEISGLGSQGLRDAECERLMALTPEYEMYHKLQPEVNVINRLTWIFTELAKNCRSMAWEAEVK